MLWAEDGFCPVRKMVSNADATVRLRRMYVFIYCGLLVSLLLWIQFKNIFRYKYNSKKSKNNPLQARKMRFISGKIPSDFIGDLTNLFWQEGDTAVAIVLDRCSGVAYQIKVLNFAENGICYGNQIV